MTAIDFETAYDSVNWNFLLKSLETFGFGESFIAWITMFYKNILSCVTNNGFSTPFFNLKRGGPPGRSTITIAFYVGFPKGKSHI